MNKDKNIYHFTVKDADDNLVHLNDYKGKVLLIVNTATHCGFTPQYEGLQKLYKQFNKQGFELLDFPCNQFGNQAPESNGEIVNFCQQHYATTFKTFAKIKVNGVDADPLYKFLKQQKSGALLGRIKWNFTKFLVDSEGHVVKRYSSATTPDKISSDIQQLLKKES